jgi:hypothetical protein
MELLKRLIAGHRESTPNGRLDGVDGNVESIESTRDTGRQEGAPSIRTAS